MPTCYLQRDGWIVKVDGWECDVDRALRAEYWATRPMPAVVNALRNETYDVRVTVIVDGSPPTGHRNSASIDEIKATAETEAKQREML